jgi:hypothetical protein
MHDASDAYKIKKNPPHSLTYLQILACLKIFIEKEKSVDGSEGWISVKDMYEIIKEDLLFKASYKEIEFMLKKEYVEDFRDKVDLSKEKVNFSTFINIVDILKREKLVLVQLGNNLNYFIFILLATLIIIYISTFYNYKIG